MTTAAHPKRTDVRFYCDRPGCAVRFEWLGPGRNNPGTLLVDRDVARAVLAAEDLGWRVGQHESTCPRHVREENEHGRSAR